MGRNVEIKARSAEPAKQRTVVEALADHGPEILEQEDTFFHCPEGRLKLRRLSPDEGELIFYRRPDTLEPTESRYEIFRTSKPEMLAAVLAAALGVLGVVRKTRTLFLAGSTRIHLDTVEGLGEFIELEVVLTPQQDQAAGIETARRLMERIGIRHEDLVARAYLDLYGPGPRGDTMPAIREEHGDGHQHQVLRGMRLPSQGHQVGGRDSE
jgi:adenylate cyclase